MRELQALKVEALLLVHGEGVDSESLHAYAVEDQGQQPKRRRFHRETHQSATTSERLAFSAARLTKDTRPKIDCQFCEMHVLAAWSSHQKAKT